MATTPYDLRNDYIEGGKVSSSDLNRRAQLFAAQLPGALHGAALGEGVLPLWQRPDEGDAGELVASIAEAALESLAVTRVGGNFVAAEGAAFVLHPDGHLVYTRTEGLTVASQTPESGETLYIHLQLAMPDDPLDFGALDSQAGEAPSLIVTELEEEPGAVRLASVNDAGELTDARTFVAPVLLANAFAEVIERLEALENATGEDDDDEEPGPVTVSVAEFNALKARVTALETAVEALQEIIGGGPTTGITSDLDKHAILDLARVEVAVTRLEPTFSLEADASIHIAGTAGDGEDYGNGVSARDIHSGNTTLNLLTGEES